MKSSTLAMALLCTFLEPTLSFALTHATPAEDALFENDVLIRSDGHDPQTGDTGPAYCNGTLLSPRLVVTAAHCLSDAKILKSNLIRIEVGRYRYIKRPDGQVVRVGYAAYLQEEKLGNFIFSSALSRRIASQGFSVSIGPEEDIAIAVLNSPLSLSADFVFAQTASSSEFSSVTYTPHNFSPTVVTNNPFEEISTMDTKRMASLDFLNWTGYFESKSTARVNPGDSGSPLWMKLPSGWRIVAVVKGAAHTPFSSWDAFAPLGPLTCDLASQLTEPALRTLLCH